MVLGALEQRIRNSIRDEKRGGRWIDRKHFAQNWNDSDVPFLYRASDWVPGWHFDHVQLHVDCVGVCVDSDIMQTVFQGRNLFDLMQPDCFCTRQDIEDETEKASEINSVLCDGMAVLVFDDESDSTTLLIPLDNRFDSPNFRPLAERNLRSVVRKALDAEDSSIMDI